MSEFKIAGKSIPRYDLPDKAVGMAKFAADITAAQPLVGLILRSPLPHARIVSMNTKEAKEIPGVRTVLTGKDCPIHHFGLEIKDMCWLARDGYVRYIGDPVAAVAAESMDAAQAALDSIKVRYEALEPVVDLLEARDGKGPLVHEDWEKVGLGPNGEGNVIGRYEMSMGDVEIAMEKADHIFETHIPNPIRALWIHRTSCLYGGTGGR